eukprot:maker-scaffold_67-snap-gene-0.0-mRNA-1 protein AED:0.00 eAED:0.00 QI:47/1/1/1/1/1/2/76/350
MNMNLGKSDYFGGIKAQHYDDFVHKLPDLSEKTVCITGSTSGLGFWTVIAAIRKNAKSIFLLNRESERVFKSMESFENEKENCKSKTLLINIPCDLSSFTSIRKGVEIMDKELKELDLDIHILINNAGIGSLIKTNIETEDGFHSCMQIDYLGHFLLTKLLFPYLLKASKTQEVRIVQHSSFFRNIGSKKINKLYFTQDKIKTSNAEVYHQAKLGNMCFAQALFKKLKGTNIKSLVAEPGLSETELLRKQEGVIANLYGWSLVGLTKLGVMGVQAPEDGALSLIQCAFGSSEEVHSGDFYKPTTFTTGIPVKIISEGKCDSSVEYATLDVDNQRNLWKYSEEAIGEEFII